ncbi:MAG TPA: ABC transporter substrate-binding protein [Allosphingosinicella sp.]|jgi:iron complex transport system substrate-binding protein
MRGFAFAWAISLAVAAPAEAAAPVRAASLNLCTDELLLLLGAPRQIVSVTHLAQSPAETPLWRAARRYGRNDGSLVSVVGLRPNLVLTMGGGARDRVRIAQRLRLKILDLPYPQTLGDIEASVRSVGAALGNPGRAAATVEAMRRLRRAMPAGAADTIWLGGGGRSVGAQSLAAQWMRLAGLRQRPLRGDRVGLEQLLAAPPKVLLRSDYRSGEYSGEQRWLAHPLAQMTRAGRALRTDGRLWTCMGPLMVAEIARLRTEAAR